MKNRILYLMKALLIGIVLLPGSFIFPAQQENWTGDLIITLHNNTNQKVLPESEALQLHLSELAPGKSGSIYLSKSKRGDVKTIPINISNFSRVYDPTFPGLTLDIQLYDYPNPLKVTLIHSEFAGVPNLSKLKSKTLKTLTVKPQSSDSPVTLIVDIRDKDFTQSSVESKQ